MKPIFKRKKTEPKTIGELGAPKSRKKFHLVMMKVGKRNVIIACSVLLIGVAVLMNWILFSGAAGKNDGYSGYDKPSGTVSQTQSGEQTPTSTDPTQSYFSATQVSRERARAEELEVLQSVVDNTDASEDVKAEALAGITTIAEEIQKEANIESLITAKGFDQCVAVLNGDKASIIVKAETLQPAQLAQINEIVYSQTGILPTGITIINK